MPDIEVTEAVEMFSADPARVGKKDTWVTYVVNGARTYSIIIPSEEATEARIEEEIGKAESERAKLIGKKFTV